MNPNIARGVAASLVVWCRLAAAEPAPVVVQIEQDTPEIDPTALRDAVARELSGPVVSEDRPEGRLTRVIVRIDRAHGELAVGRRDALGASTERRVPLPADPAEALRVAVYLVGNLVRDEAGELLRELRPPEEPAPPPAAMTGGVQSPAPAPVEESRKHSFWIGVSAEGDLVFLPGANDICALQSSPYECAGGGGTLVARDLTVRGMGDRVTGGLTSANARLLATVDYAVSDRTLLGARVGATTATYPGTGASAFGHLHLEARATFLLGSRPLATTGLSPEFVLGVGLAEYSASVPITVYTVAPGGGVAAGNARAWMIAGPGFASTGAGVRWALGSDFALSLVPLKATLAFGTNDPMLFLSPEISAQFGF